ncbi:MAG: virulence-associated protein E, partial [Rhizobiaceae bacterium]
DRSLSVLFTDSGFVVKSFADDDWRECRDHVKALLGIYDDGPTKPVAFNDNPDLDCSVLIEQEHRIDYAARIWAETTPLAGTLAERYLASRGIAYDGEALRYHLGKRMMVAMMTDAVTGEPCGVHRTFLDPDGKKRDRKMLGRAAGAVVRLADNADVTYGLGIAEGIETSLRAPFWPMWACLSAGTMKALPVLAGITSLSIFADQDKAGLEAANECGQRWHTAGVEVTMAAPLSGDFADIREAA